MDAINDNYLSRIKPGIKSSVRDMENSIKRIYDYKKKISAKAPYILMRYQILKDSNDTYDKVEEEDIIMRNKGLLCDEIQLRRQHDWAGKIEESQNHDKLLSCKDICGDFHRSMNIQWNGDVSFCCLDYDGEIVLGNVLNSDIVKIYNSEPMDNARRMYLEGIVYQHKLCSGCYWRIIEIK